MRKTFLALAVTGMLAGCTTAEKSAVVGAAAGAAIGGIATGTGAGAAIGAGIGGATGYLIGRVADRPGYCRYRTPDGRIYTAKC